MTTHAEPLGLICVTGEGAKKFLQGQLTCNLDEISSEISCLGAHCNPQGRIISLFTLFLRNDDYYLQMPIDLIPIALAALQKYAVFFKVKLHETPNTISNLSEETWKKLNISAGIPTIYAVTSEKFLPHELNLHKLQGISFNKGCYTGQEIIARMHYRGKLKTHMYRVKAESNEPPQLGNEIFNSSTSSGNIVDFVQVGYNSYELLITALEADVNSNTLFLNKEKTTRLEILTLPYSL